MITVRIDTSAGWWTALPDEMIYDPGMTLAIIRCYAALVRWGRTEASDLTQEDMASDLGMNAGTIRRSMKWLDDAGWIDRTPRLHGAITVGTDYVVNPWPTARADRAGHRAEKRDPEPRPDARSSSTTEDPETQGATTRADGAGSALFDASVETDWVPSAARVERARKHFGLTDAEFTDIAAAVNIDASCRTDKQRERRWSDLVRWKSEDNKRTRGREDPLQASIRYAREQEAKEAGR